MFDSDPASPITDESHQKGKKTDRQPKDQTLAFCNKIPRNESDGEPSEKHGQFEYVDHAGLHINSLANVKFPPTGAIEKEVEK